MDFLLKFLHNRNITYNSEKIKYAYKKNFDNLDYNLENGDLHHIFIKKKISNLFNSLKIEISDSDREQIKQEMEKVMLKNPPILKKGVKETLEALSPNYKIGLVSNTGITPGKVILEVFKKYDIYKYFQVTIFSDEVGYYKPKSVLFETALNKLDCKAHYAIHVGDLLHTDIKGAKAYGILTIWFNDNNQPKLPGIEPDYEVKKIFEIVPIINNLS